MDLGKVDHRLSIIANIGVLVGVIFLVIEIQQNTNTIDSQLQQAIFSGTQENLFKWLEYPEIAAYLIDPELEMSTEDKVRIDALLNSSMRAREFSWRQYNAGILSDENWEFEENIISIIVGTERAREWWREIGIVQFTGEFRTVVSNIIENQPLHSYWISLKNWQ